jgi:hypothetical protein
VPLEGAPMGWAFSTNWWPQCLHLWRCLPLTCPFLTVWGLEHSGHCIDLGLNLDFYCYRMILCFYHNRMTQLIRCLDYMDADRTL